jgi:hypothetical protein
MLCLGLPAFLEVDAGNLLQNAPVHSIKSIRDPFPYGDYPISVVRPYYSELAQTPPVGWAYYSELSRSVVVRSSVETTIQVSAPTTIELIISPERSLLLNLFNCLDSQCVLPC